MHDLIQFALLGVGAGSAYVLLAQGVVLIYRASGVVNFAQGALAMFGAYTFVELQQHHWGYLEAAGAAVIITGLVGLLIYQLVMRRLRDASPLARAIATLGILAILQAVGSLRYQDNLVVMQISLPHNVVHLGSVIVPADRLWLAAIACGLTAALYLISKFTLVGLATSAVSESEIQAAALGWSPDLVAGINWFIGSMLAAVAGILVSPLSGLNVTILVLLIVPTLAAALVGGFASFGLTLVGGLGIGILQSEMGRYVTAPGWRDAIPFLVIMFILIVRGKGLPLRGYLIERLPDLGTGRIRLVPTVVVTGVLIALLYGPFSVNWVDHFTVSFVFAIMLLSVVILTGYAGQLSLAQFTFGGIGALFTARLVRDHWPFELALLVGVVGTAFVGLILGLPALRTRGVNLAVVTLGLGAAVEAVVFNNHSYTGGLEGTHIGSPTLFGISFDFVSHPRNYSAICLVFLVLVSFVVCNIRRSRTGRRLIAVRTNERAAASLGVSVLESKLYAFSLSAGIAGLAGTLYAFRGDMVTYADFEPFHSITVVTLAVVGGIGYVVGASLGSTLAAGGFGVIIADAVVGSNEDQWLALVGGVVLIVILLQDPNGMARQNVVQISRISQRLRTKFGRGAARIEALPVLARTRVNPVAMQVRGLTVRFGGVVALNGVDLDVNPGEVVGLIGPNGAGKTTFIDAVTGFVKPSAGSISLGGHSVQRWAPHRRARAGLTRSFQSLELFDDVTVRDNLRAAADSRGRWSYLTDLFWPKNVPLSPASVAAIREFDLEDDLDKRPDELPYGRRRLVAIARSVATEPSVLLLDEPAAGLGEMESAELATLVRRLADDWGIGVLLIEHDMSVVMKICDRINVLDFGNRIASGTAEEIRRDPVVVSAYLGSPVELINDVEDLIVPTV